jgi:hypothetical protein
MDRQWIEERNKRHPNKSVDTNKIDILHSMMYHSFDGMTDSSMCNVPKDVLIGCY